MSRTILFCQEVPELKIGPGRLPDIPANTIRFREGYAFIDKDDPDYTEKLRWATAAGTPKIEVLGEAESVTRVVPNELAVQVVCSKCGKAFKDQGGLNAHMFSEHLPAGLVPAGTVQAPEPKPQPKPVVHRPVVRRRSTRVRAKA